jgi:hypothetical protein
MRRLNRITLLSLAITAASMVSLGLGSPVQAAPAGAQSELVAVAGVGQGLVVVAPTSAAGGTFDARVTVNVHGAAPNASWAVTRAVDIPGDGTCSSTDFEPVATLDTSSGGAGAVTFERTSPLPSGANFDLVLRVSGTDGTVLQSGCTTIYVK